jgi:hypothetical protein
MDIVNSYVKVDSRWLEMGKKVPILQATRTYSTVSSCQSAPSSKIKQSKGTLEDGAEGFPKTSVTNYQSTLRNIP